jgi:phosphatidylglycerol:prolipoprotein diacylglycerol transferase
MALVSRGKTAIVWFMDPICFHVCTRPVYWYGVMMALAFLAGIGHWQALGRRTGQRDVAFASDLAFWLMVGGIVGARLAYVGANFDYFIAAPMEIIRVDQGGLIFYGGFIGAVLAFIVFARSRREKVLELADFAITALPLGHALGRVGCFLNGCCQGCVVKTPSLLSANLNRYPVQLYEAAFNLVVYAVLTIVYLRRRGQCHGQVLATYLILYPAGRFLLEFLRGDERLRWGFFSAAQCLSLALMALGMGLWIVVQRQHENDHRTP